MLPCSPMRLRLCGALALSALVLSACAPAASRPSIAQARASTGADAHAGTDADADAEADTEADGQAGYPAELASMQFAAPPVANVRELGDGELSCAEIYAETQALDRTAREQQAKAHEAQEAMAKSQEAMIKQATSRSSGMGTIGGGLLSMVPGGGLVSGLAMKAATNSRASAMQEESNRLMRTQTEMMNTEQALQYTRARSDHLAGLFLDKGCRLSDVQRVPSAAQ